MRKKQLLFTLAALTILSLSGCHKDKPVTKTEPLETIAPETQSETISDKLDDTADTLEIHGNNMLIKLSKKNTLPHW